VSPEPLPEPPADYGLLIDFPTLGKDDVPPRLYRVHRVDRAAEWFSTSGTMRFDPPGGAADLFGTCYLAVDPVTALIEAVGDLPALTQQMLDNRAMMVAQIPVTQKLANMTSPLVVGRWRLDRRISMGDDYEICQRWARALRLAGFSGVYYEPRHDPSDREEVRPASVALFADPGYQPHMMARDGDGPISTRVIERAEDVFGLQVLPSAPLPSAAI
jgi:hypothetical protein